MALIAKARPHNGHHIALYLAIAPIRTGVLLLLFAISCLASSLAQEQAPPTMRFTVESYTGSAGVFYNPRFFWTAPRSSAGTFRGATFVTRSERGAWTVDNAVLYTSSRLRLISARLHAGRTPRGSFVQFGPQANLETLPGVSKIMQTISVAWLSKMQGARNSNLLIVGTSKPLALGKGLRTHFESIYVRDFAASLFLGEYRAFLHLPGDKRIQPGVLIQQSSKGVAWSIGARISLH